MTTLNHHYSILIQWSEEDQLYLVTIPEFVGLAMQPCTHGKTYEEAAMNAQDCIAVCLDYFEHQSIIPPTPKMAQVA